MRRLLLSCLALLGLLAGSGPSARAELPGTLPVATRFGDFDHDTFAVTWQPGLCAVGQGCLPSQPKGAVLGLHGLWASRPSVLVAKNIPEQQWWVKGCDDLAPHTDAAPVLSAGLRARLDAAAPHLAHDLVTHEWDKHGACFGYAPEAFFATALAMRDEVALNPFATWLTAHEGQVVRHDDAFAAFRADFHTDHPRAVQFQCGTDGAGHVVLTQLWITLLPAKLRDFPAPETLIDAPIPQDSCPAAFLIPAW